MNFYSLLTSVGAAKQNHAQETRTTVNLTQLAVCDGNGQAVTPNKDLPALPNEVWRGYISSVTQDKVNPSWLIIETVIPAAVGGWYVRAFGIFDDVGDMIYMGNFPETYKPILAENSTRDMLIRVIVETSSTANITLVVDPSVTTATQQGIDNKMAQHVAQLDPHPQYATKTRLQQDLDNKMAQHVAQLDPHTQYATKTQLQQAIGDIGGYLIDAGVANAYVVALTPPIDAYPANLSFKVKIAHPNTGASTLDAGGGPLPLVRDDGTPVQAGDVHGLIDVQYDQATNQFWMVGMAVSQLGDMAKLNLGDYLINDGAGKVAVDAAALQSQMYFLTQ